MSKRNVALGIGGLALLVSILAPSVISERQVKKMDRCEVVGQGFDSTVYVCQPEGKEAIARVEYSMFPSMDYEREPKPSELEIYRGKK
jgi:hypothetical protein